MSRLFLSGLMTALVALAALAAPGSARAQNLALLAELYGEGVHSYFAGDYRAAYDALSESIDGGARDPRAYYFRGLVLEQMGRPQEALADFALGARFEVQGSDRHYDVNSALQRVQGRSRLLIEDYRQQARVTAAQAAQDERRRLYQRTQGDSAAVQRRPVSSDPADYVLPVPAEADADAGGADLFAPPQITDTPAAVAPGSDVDEQFIGGGSAGGDLFGGDDLFPADDGFAQPAEVGSGVGTETGVGHDEVEDTGLESGLSDNLFGPNEDDVSDGVAETAPPSTEQENVARDEAEDTAFESGEDGGEGVGMGQVFGHILQGLSDAQAVPDGAGAGPSEGVLPGAEEGHEMIPEFAPLPGGGAAEAAIPIPDGASAGPSEGVEPGAEFEGDEATNPFEDDAAVPAADGDAADDNFDDLFGG